MKRLAADTLIVAAALAAMSASVIGGGMLADRLPAWAILLVFIALLTLSVMALIRVGGRP